jgi:hypothetical protein
MAGRLAGNVTATSGKDSIFGSENLWSEIEVKIRRLLYFRL